MRVSVLASGSKGNCTFIETQAMNILIDLGPTCSYIERKLLELGISPDKINMILITHTHTDHTNGLKVFYKKYHPKLYLTQKIYEDLCQIVPITDYEIITEDFDLGNIHVGMIKTSHDASDSNGYIIEENQSSMVYITDTGYINQKYFPKLSNKTVYVMESNHDVEMLMHGKYPYPLRRRILSDSGHLSNLDSANYLVRFIGENTKKIILAHLSEENNTPALALDTLRGILEEHEITFSNIEVATQNEKTEPIEI